jgi:hypothetical protein
MEQTTYTVPQDLNTASGIINDIKVNGMRVEKDESTKYVCVNNSIVISTLQMNEVIEYIVMMDSAFAYAAETFAQILDVSPDLLPKVKMALAVGGPDFTDEVAFFKDDVKNQNETLTLFNRIQLDIATPAIKAFFVSKCSEVIQCDLAIITQLKEAQKNLENQNKEAQKQIALATEEQAKLESAKMLLKGEATKLREESEAAKKELANKKQHNTDELKIQKETLQTEFEALLNGKIGELSSLTELVGQYNTTNDDNQSKNPGTRRRK